MNKENCFCIRDVFVSNRQPTYLGTTFLFSRVAIHPLSAKAEIMQILL